MAAFLFVLSNSHAIILRVLLDIYRLAWPRLCLMPWLAGVRRLKDPFLVLLLSNFPVYFLKLILSLGHFLLKHFQVVSSTNMSWPVRLGSKFALIFWKLALKRELLSFNRGVSFWQNFFIRFFNNNFICKIISEAMWPVGVKLQAFLNDLIWKKNLRHYPSIVLSSEFAIRFAILRFAISFGFLITQVEFELLPQRKNRCCMSWFIARFFLFLLIDFLFVNFEVISYLAASGGISWVTAGLSQPFIGAIELALHTFPNLVNLRRSHLRLNLPDTIDQPFNYFVFDVHRLPSNVRLFFFLNPFYFLFSFFGIEVVLLICDLPVSWGHRHFYWS